MSQDIEENINLLHEQALNLNDLWDRAYTSMKFALEFSGQPVMAEAISKRIDDVYRALAFKPIDVERLIYAQGTLRALKDAPATVRHYVQTGGLAGRYGGVQINGGTSWTPPVLNG